MSAPNPVKLKIDGVEVTVPEGTMILKAAKDIGIILHNACCSRIRSHHHIRETA